MKVDPMQFYLPKLATMLAKDYGDSATVKLRRFRHKQEIKIVRRFEPAKFPWHVEMTLEWPGHGTSIFCDGVIYGDNIRPHHVSVTVPGLEHDPHDALVEKMCTYVEDKGLVAAFIRCTREQISYYNHDEFGQVTGYNGHAA